MTEVAAQSSVQRSDTGGARSAAEGRWSPSVHASGHRSLLPTDDTAQPWAAAGDAGQPWAGAGDTEQPWAGAGDTEQPWAAAGDTEQPWAAAGNAAQPWAGGRETANQASELAPESVDRLGDAVDRAAAASTRVAGQVVDRLRDNAELDVERGTTTIADEVVEKVAGIAAHEVAGVYELGGDVARVFSAARERAGLGESDSDRGVAVRLEGAVAAIKVTMVVEYGYAVYSVTERVRANVIQAVENMLGLEVARVDILVGDVHVPENGPDATHS